MCITPALCISGGKLWFLVLVEKTGAWLVVTENVGVSCFGCFSPPSFGYVFNQVSNNLVKFCPLNFKASGGFLILSFPVSLPFLSPVSQCMCHIFSLPLHKFGSRKEKDHGDLCDSAHSYPLISLWKHLFLVLSVF